MKEMYPSMHNWNHNEVIRLNGRVAASMLLLSEELGAEMFDDQILLKIDLTASESLTNRWDVWVMVCGGRWLVVVWSVWRGERCDVGRRKIVVIGGIAGGGFCRRSYVVRWIWGRFAGGVMVVGKKKSKEVEHSGRRRKKMILVVRYRDDGGFRGCNRLWWMVVVRWWVERRWGFVLRERASFNFSFLSVF